MIDFSGIRLIVTDLDRTLLRPDNTISEETVTALKACQERGIQVVFATARPECGCRKLVRKICPDGVISNCGALVRYQGQVIGSNLMDAEVASRLLINLRSHPQVGYITVDSEQGFYVNSAIDPDDPNWTDYYPAFESDFAEGIGCRVFKVTAEINDPESAVRMLDGIQGVSTEAFSGENWYKYTVGTVNKWTGIEVLLQHMGLVPEDVIAFGDDYSDILMLTHCGVGVAMDNAIPEVKAIADQICPSNQEDGVAMLLKQTLLR